MTLQEIIHAIIDNINSVLEEYNSVYLELTYDEYVDPDWFEEFKENEDASKVKEVYDFIDIEDAHSFSIESIWEYLYSEAEEVIDAVHKQVDDLINQYWKLIENINVTKDISVPFSYEVLGYIGNNKVYYTIESGYDFLFYI